MMLERSFSPARLASLAPLLWVCVDSSRPLLAQAPDDGSSRNPLVETKSEQDHLTGDWGGWRTRLVERGVHLQAGYIGEAIGNVSGGLRTGVVYEGLAELALELDLERLTGWWANGTFRVSGLFPHGRSPTGQLVGDLQGVSNIDAYDSVALYELWLDQTFFDDRLSLRAGQLLADAEFATTEYGSVLMQSSFGWPAFISGNTRSTGPAFPRAAPGFRLRVAPTGAFFVQGAIFDGDTLDDDGNPHGWNLKLDGAKELFGMAETGWNLNAGKDATGMPGSYKFGGWWHTGDFADQYESDRLHGGNYGIYVVAEQMIWREGSAEKSDEGLGLFCRLGLSPTDRNQFPFTFDGGAHYQGLFPGRANDVLAAGVAWVEISEDRRRAERAQGVDPLSDREIALEVSYVFNLRPWFTIQPDFQWIHHPGGSTALDDAIVLGLRTRITF